MNKTRPKQLSFRVSEEEYRQLQEKILESGKNQQDYTFPVEYDRTNKRATLVLDGMMNAKLYDQLDKLSADNKAAFRLV